MISYAQEQLSSLRKTAVALQVRGLIQALTNYDQLNQLKEANKSERVRRAGPSSTATLSMSKRHRPNENHTATGRSNLETQSNWSESSEAVATANRAIFWPGELKNEIDDIEIDEDAWQNNFAANNSEDHSHAEQPNDDVETHALETSMESVSLYRSTGITFNFIEKKAVFFH